MRRMSILAGSKYLFIGGIVAGALAATSPAVLADGMAPKAQAMEAPATWSGFYIGTNSGWAASSIDGTLGTPVGVGGGPGRYSVDYDTEFWGLVLGVQHQIGGVVIGVEGNLLSMFADNAGSTQLPQRGVALHGTHDRHPVHRRPARRSHGPLDAVRQRRICELIVLLQS